MFMVISKRLPNGFTFYKASIAREMTWILQKDPQIVLKCNVDPYAPFLHLVYHIWYTNWSVYHIWYTERIGVKTKKAIYIISFFHKMRSAHFLVTSISFRAGMSLYPHGNIPELRIRFPLKQRKLFI